MASFEQVRVQIAYFLPVCKVGLSTWEKTIGTTHKLQSVSRFQVEKHNRVCVRCAWLIIQRTTKRIRCNLLDSQFSVVWQTMCHIILIGVWEELKWRTKERPQGVWNSYRFTTIFSTLSKCDLFCNTAIENRTHKNNEFRKGPHFCRKLSLWLCSEKRESLCSCCQQRNVAPLLV